MTTVAAKRSTRKKAATKKPSPAPRRSGKASKQAAAPNPAPRLAASAPNAKPKTEQYPDYLDTKTLRVIGRRAGLERKVGKPVEELSRYQIMNELLLMYADRFVLNLLSLSNAGKLPDPSN